MSKRFDNLLIELKSKQRCCVCGGVEYPANWHEKTQIKAIQAGLIQICPCSTETRRFIRIISQ